MRRFKPMPPAVYRFLKPILLLALAFALAAPAHAGENQDYQIILKLVRDGALQTATQQAETYLKNHPKGPHQLEVTGLLGRLLVKTGRPAAALPYLEEALKAAPAGKRGPLILSKAGALVGLRKPGEALKALQTLKPVPASLLIQYRDVAAEAYLAQDKPKNAVHELSRIPPGRRSASQDVRLGYALTLTGDNKKAEKVLSACLGRSGLPPQLEGRAREMLAGCQYRLQDYKGMLKTSAPLLKSPAYAKEGALLSAWAYHKTGRDAKAYDLVRKALPLQGWEAAAALAPIRTDALALRDADLINRAKQFVSRFGDSTSSREVYLDWAGALHRRGDDAGALKALRSGLSKIQNPRLKLRAALEAARLAWNGLHDWDRASRFLKMAEVAAHGSADSASVLLEKARLTWARGGGSDALGALADLVQNHPGTPAVPDAYLLLGRIRCAEGEREQGRKAYEVVLQSFPDSPDYPAAALAYAQSLAADGNLEDAAGSLAMLKGLPLPGEEGVRRDLLLGELALEGGHPEAALPPLSQALDTQLAPAERDRALFLSGEARLSAGGFKEAKTLFLRIQDSEYRQAGLCRLADALWKAKKQEEARPIFQRLVSGGGRSRSTALWILASLEYKADDEKAGMVSLQKLVALDPEDPLSVLAQRRLEMTLLTGKGPGAALMAIPDFLAAEPWNPEESVHLLQEAQSRVRSGRYQEAAALYRKFLKRFPNAHGVSEARLFLARQAMKRSDWQQAARELKEVPSSPERDLLMGETAYHMRDMASALQALQSVLSNPKGPGLEPAQILRAEYLAGMAARIQSKTDEAVKYLGDYASKAPADASQKDSLLSAALWLQREGALKPALEAFKRLNSAYRDAAIGFQYGYTYELMKKYQEALDAYLKVTYASANAQWALVARYRAAELMLAMGRKADAVALYKKLVEQTKGTVQGAYAEQRLEQLQGGNGSAPGNPEKPAANPGRAGKGGSKHAPAAGTH